MSSQVSSAAQVRSWVTCRSLLLLLSSTLRTGRGLFSKLFLPLSSARPLAVWTAAFPESPASFSFVSSSMSKEAHSRIPFGESPPLNPKATGVKVK